MPFDEPIDIDNSAYPNDAQETVFVGGGKLTATIDNAVLTVEGTIDANIVNAVINAVVTGNVIVESGEVNVGGILTPVLVQGGGEVLIDTTGTIPAGGGAIINIPAPPSGLTYAGIGVVMQITGAVGSANPLTCYVYNTGYSTGLNTNFAPASTGGSIGSFGAPSTARALIPVGTSFPIRMDINNDGPVGSQSYRLVVVGLSYADAMVRDFGQWENGVEGEVSFDNAVINSYVTIGASFETREFLLVGVSATVGRFQSEVMLSDGTWEQTQLRLQNSHYGGGAGTTDVVANTNSLITIPGDGRVHRIKNASALNGFCRLSYIGKR